MRQAQTIANQAAQIEDQQACINALETKVAALEKENAELKTHNGEIMARHCDVMNSLVEENQHLKKIVSVSVPSFPCIATADSHSPQTIPVDFEMLLKEMTTALEDTEESLKSAETKAADWVKRHGELSARFNWMSKVSFFPRLWNERNPNKKHPGQPSTSACVLLPGSDGAVSVQVHQGSDQVPDGEYLGLL